MTFLSRLKVRWVEDALLQRVVRNSGYLFSASTLGMLLTSVQGILAALLLGPAEYGLLGMIVLFASSVNRLLSFRMGELVVRYAGEYLATGQRERAAAVVKGAGLGEALTSVVAYLLLWLLAPLGALYILKDPQSVGWIRFYGLALLANLVTETSTAVLQLANHYRYQAAINLAQSLLTACWIVAAFFFGGGLRDVLLAYLAGKLVTGLATAGVALRWTRPTFGEGWLRAPLKLLPAWRELFSFAVSTNLSGTINMVIRDSEVLWVGFFLSSLEAGYYKFALAVMNILLMPVTPFISTTFPEISRAVARRDWKPLRRLLSRTSMLALAWTLLSALGMALFGRPLLGWLKGGAYLPALPAVFILLLGYGAANVLFWNRPLMLSFGRPNEPLSITALVGTLKTALMFVLVRPLGFLAQAGLMSAYLLTSVGWIALRGVRAITAAERFGSVDDRAGDAEEYSAAEQPLPTEGES